MYNSENTPAKIYRHTSWNDLMWDVCVVTKMAENGVISQLCFIDISNILLKFCSSL